MLKPTFIARELKNASGYIVIVSWPDGLEEQVSDFATEADAKAWIEHDAGIWLGKHPMTAMTPSHPN